MFNTTEIQKVILPEVTAEAILFGLYSNCRENMDINQFTFGFAEVYIPKTGGYVGVRCEINELDATVEYLVAANPDADTDYTLLDYTTARRELRGYLNSEILF